MLKIELFLNRVSFEIELLFEKFIGFDFMSEVHKLRVRIFHVKFHCVVIFDVDTPQLDAQAKLKKEGQI